MLPRRRCSQWDFSQGTSCAIMCEELKTFCLNMVVLKNILTVLQETRGDPIGDNFSNRSPRYAAYKQFIWWVFKKLGKTNRRVIPSRALQKIRELYPEANVNYIMNMEGKQD